MPKTIRDHLKGSLATAILDLDRALAQIAEVEEEFEPVHPELAEGLTLSATLIIRSQELLKAFYAAAWGSLPGDWVVTRERK